MLSEIGIISGRWHITSSDKEIASSDRDSRHDFQQRHHNTHRSGITTSGKSFTTLICGVIASGNAPALNIEQVDASETDDVNDGHICLETCQCRKEDLNKRADRCT